ncbi:MAG: pectinesterase family protein [Clostridia bacterium]|nr:pectinesterase family protein [Clostridia bacterium]
MTKLHLTPADDIGKILENLAGPATICLAPGVYRQKIHIKADNVTIRGAGRETCVITHGDFARAPHPDGRDRGTFRTETVLITGDGVRMENLTIENDAGCPEVNGQAVALYVHSKNFYGENLGIKSMQDTLFLSPLPDDLVARYRGVLPDEKLYREGAGIAVFSGCVVFGSIDFVFGGARALFSGCEFVSLKDERGQGFVAAPSHPLAEETGFVFNDCLFSSDGVDMGTVFLARPWRDFGKCAFIDCEIKEHINPCLFDKWGDTERDKTARFLYASLTSDFPLDPAPWAKKMTEEEKKLLLSPFDGFL